VTFTFPLLQAARRVLLLVTGESKRAAMAAVAEGPDPAVPASLLALGPLEVVVDAAAAPAPAR
jgi:6-phosphogluconolactonase